MKVSFDFDQTLDKVSVQKFAKELIEKGMDVWIHTSRYSDERAPSKDWNLDLWHVCDELGIPHKNVVFCEMTDKWKSIIDKDFMWHLDDDWVELDLISQHTNCIGVSVFGNSNWKKKCNKIIEFFEIKPLK